MIEENTNAGNEMVETATTESVEQTTEQQTPVVEERVNDKEYVAKQSEAKSFTQDQVNEFVRQRIDRERMSVYHRYGVEDRNGLDDLIGKAQSYDVMKERYNQVKTAKAELEQEIAFIENNINPEKKDDVLAYFKGKGLQVNKEEMAKEVSTHPEWLRVVEKSDKPITTIKQVSPDRGGVETTDEKAEMSKLFGINIL